MQFQHVANIPFAVSIVDSPILRLCSRTIDRCMCEFIPYFSLPTRKTEWLLLLFSVYNFQNNYLCKYYLNDRTPFFSPKTNLKQWTRAHCLSQQISYDHKNCLINFQHQWTGWKPISRRNQFVTLLRAHFMDVQKNSTNFMSTDAI